MPKKTAIVTGAYRGIGIEVVRQLAKRGFEVFLSARNEKKAQAAIDKLSGEGLSVKFLAMDVSDPASVKKAAVLFGKLGDKLDVLINNAAILLDKQDDAARMDPSILDETFRTNVTGPVLTIQAFLPYLKKSNNARVINVSSGAGSLTETMAFAPAYSMSKTALNAVTTQFATALAKDGIAVNSACPGWVRTEMGGPSAPRSVEEGADTIVWLADEAPQNVTAGFWRDRKPAAW